MSRIAVTGAAGPVGRRVCALAAADPDVDEVLAIDRDDVGDIGAWVKPHRVHLREADLDALFDGVDVVCHLAGSDPLEETVVDHDVHTTSRVLEAAGRAGVRQIVARSSATVYGAWADNPIPLTEADPVHPNPEATWVQVRVRVEELLQAFAEANPSCAVAVVRPTVTVSPDGPDELGRVLATARMVVTGDDEPPVQFVHADDVASAVDVVRRRAASGAFNVAPDRSMDGAMLRALVGGRPRVRLPDWLTRRLGEIGWRYRLAPTPPGFGPFAAHPWVVANDRLRELGWEPTHTSDEAFVAGHEAAPWAQISPQRRQELALGAAVVAILGIGGGAAVALRRRIRHR